MIKFSTNFFILNKINDFNLINDVNKVIDIIDTKKLNSLESN